MLFEKIYDSIAKVDKPSTGDLILFQIEDGQWTAALYPMLAQKLYADNYNSIEQKALEFAADWSERGRQVSVWKEVDANKDEYSKVL